MQETFADLGEQSLKNIARPVHAYALQLGAATSAPAASPKARNKSFTWSALAVVLVAVLVAAGAFAWRKYASRPAPAPPTVSAAADRKLAHSPRLSIVVLPFANLSGDPEQDYFADALTDDLTTDLSHLADSFVIARNTAFTYQGKAVDARQVGRDLGVRYALSARSTHSSQPPRTGAVAGMPPATEWRVIAVSSVADEQSKVLFSY